MHSRLRRTILWAVLGLGPCAWAQHAVPCGDLMHFKGPGVEISKAAPFAAGTTEANPWGPGRGAPVPAYCRVEGVMSRRTGVAGEEFGINFALAMPEQWNGHFLMQGGGENGSVMPPLGLNAAGETLALMRGFAVVSTDTGHKSHRGPFDFDFMKDQRAYLDFAYLANAEVATLAKQLNAQYYGKPAAYSYFSGCSTGGREGMILSQRYPTAFNGIISGDPAMRTGLSNLAIGQWIPVTFNQSAPNDAEGKPIIMQAISDADRKLITDALLQKCDALDGVADGMISDTLRCDFDPAVLTCKEGKGDSCLSREKVAAIKKAVGGPKTSGGVQVYPGFLYDTGIAAGGPIRGILSPGPGIFGPATTAMEVDVEKEALANIQPLVDSMSTNLTTFSGHGGKLIFYHGNSDPWFSPLDTFEYYKNMSTANGGLEAASSGASSTLCPAWRTAAEAPASISSICWVRWSIGWRREPPQRQ